MNSPVHVCRYCAAIYLVSYNKETVNVNLVKISTIYIDISKYLLVEDTAVPGVRQYGVLLAPAGDGVALSPQQGEAQPQQQQQQRPHSRHSLL